MKKEQYLGKKGESWRIRILGIIALINLGIFIVDGFLIQNSGISLLYVVSILFTLFHPEGRTTIAAGFLITCLVIAEYIILRPQSDHTLFINSAAIIFIIWTSAYFILKYKNDLREDDKNRERLRALFDYATEGILITDSKGNIVMINPTAEVMLGYDKDELLGNKIEVLIPERVSDKHVKHRENYNKAPRPRPMGAGVPLFAKKKNGTEIPVEISLSNFKTSDGAFVIAFIIDTTDRKIAEQLILKEKEKAQMYLDIAPVIFVVVDDSGSITLINQNGCRLLGYDESELTGKNWMDIMLKPEARERAADLFTKIMNGEKDALANYENEILTKDGSVKLISWKNTMIRNEKGKPVAILSAGEDISSQKHQERLIEKANESLKKYHEEILQLNAELEERVERRTSELADAVSNLEELNAELANEIRDRKEAELKLKKSENELKISLDKEKELGELKSRFVTMASHEFRTPLSTILSSVALLSKYIEPEYQEKRIKHIERIKSSVNNLTSILNDFLSLGKLEEGKVTCQPDEFNIVSFSDDIVNELKEIAKKGQTIEYEHIGNDDSVMLDRNLTRNICNNLLSNAIKYSDEGTEISFRTSISNNVFTISVTDQGIGIPENEQHHIFERFFRAQNSSNIQGTGLGLNIVKKYTEIMNGSVQFESTSGKGTTFTVSLPVRLDQTDLL